MGILNEHLNEIIAYLMLVAVGIFVLVAGFMALRHRIRIVRSTRRHRMSAARYPDRTTMLVLPAITPPTGAPPPAVPEPLSSSVLDLFDEFDQRIARLRTEIESLDATHAG